MMIQLSLALGASSAALGSSDEEPIIPTASVTLNEFSRDLVVFDSDMANGNDRADIPLSGTSDAAEGSVIQARAVSTDDGGATSTGWSDIGTVSGGAWAGTLPVPRSSSWYRAEVRLAGTAVGAQMTARFGAGLVLFFSQQSNMARFFQEGDGDYEPIGQNGNNFQVFKIDDHPNPASLISGPVFVSDERAGKRMANTDNEVVGEGVMAMAATFHKNAPGLKVMALFDVKVGEPQFATLKNSAPVRNWSNIQAMWATAFADGGNVGLVMHNHYNDVQSVTGAVTGYLAGAYFGKKLNGTDIAEIDTSGEFPSHEVISGIHINHVWPEVMPGLLSGRTQLLLGPDNFGGDAAGQLPDIPFFYETMAERFPDHVKIAPMAGYAWIGDREDSSDGNHMTRFNSFGVELHAALMAAGVLRAVGAMPFKEPIINNARWTEDYLEVWSDDGPITTWERALNGTGAVNYPAAPYAATPVPGQAEVIGFQLPGGVNLERVEIWAQDGSETRATAGRLRVYPPAGTKWTRSSQVTLAKGPEISKGRAGRPWSTGYDFGTPPADFSFPSRTGWINSLGLVRHQPIIDVGLEGRLLEYGHPARPIATESLSEANTLAGLQYTQVIRGRPRASYNDLSQSQVLTIETQIIVTESLRMWSIGSSDAWGIFRTQGATGVEFGLSAINDAGTKIFTNRRIDSVLQPDTPHKLRVAVDRNGGSAPGMGIVRLWVDDVEIIGGREGQEFGVDIAFGPQNFETARDMNVPALSSNFNSGRLARVTVWEEYLTPGDTPAGPPLLEVVSDGAGGFVGSTN